MCAIEYIAVVSGFILPPPQEVFFCQEKHMLRFLKCLLGFHGVTEIDYTVDDEEIKVCRDSLKEV